MAFDPGVLLVHGEPRRNEHDRPPALAIGTDRPASLPAAPNLDLVGVHIQNLGQEPDKSHDSCISCRVQRWWKKQGAQPNRARLGHTSGGRQPRIPLVLVGRLTHGAKVGQPKPEHV